MAPQEHAGATAIPTIPGNPDSSIESSEKWQNCHVDNSIGREIAIAIQERNIADRRHTGTLVRYIGQIISLSIQRLRTGAEEGVSEYVLSSCD